MAGLNEIKAINPFERGAVSGVEKFTPRYKTENSDHSSVATGWHGSPVNNGFGFYSDTMGIVGKKLDIMGV